jgi:hypothetical protein
MVPEEIHFLPSDEYSNLYVFTQPALVELSTPSVEGSSSFVEGSSPRKCSPESPRLLLVTANVGDCVGAKLGAMVGPALGAGVGEEVGAEVGEMSAFGSYPAVAIAFTIL